MQSARTKPTQAPDEYCQVAHRVSESLQCRLPYWLRRGLSRSYWLYCDLRDFGAESIGWLPSHRVRPPLYRHLPKIAIGRASSIDRGCRLYQPSGVQIDQNTFVNREVLLDGRMGLVIGDNVGISEGTAIFTLEHDPNNPDFPERGAPVQIQDRVFVGVRAMILPGVTLEQGAVVGAGAAVCHDVAPFTIVAGVPARPVGQRRRDLTFVLNYRKSLG